MLAGDAAPAMTPDLGQGACQPLEDAVVLAGVLEGRGGLDAYDRLRRPRTRKLARRAHRIGVAAQWESPDSRRAARHRSPPAAPFVVRPVPRPGPRLDRVTARSGIAAAADQPSSGPARQVFRRVTSAVS